MATFDTDCRRWLIYALGGGFGHLTRALALARAATRFATTVETSQPPIEVTILSNSPFAGSVPVEAELGNRHRLVQISPALDRAATVRAVRAALESESFDVLVVDTFPRGLGGELADLIPNRGATHVLVHRHVRDEYVEQCRLQEFARHYDLILVPGEPAPLEHLAHSQRTAPWLIRDSHELFPPDAAAAALRASDNPAPVVAVIGTGKSSEMAEMEELAHQIAACFGKRICTRFISPGDHRSQRLRPRSESELRLAISYWPFFELHHGVSLIVGSGGYNTVHEAHASQTPLISIPRKRMYDQQQSRLSACQTARTPAEVLVRIESNLSQLLCESRADGFSNGANEAVELILQC